MGNKMLSYKEMNQLGELIKSALPEGGQFFLFIGKAGCTKTSGVDAQYLSTIQRISALNCMKEFILKNGHEDEWLMNMDFEEE